VLSAASINSYMNATRSYLNYCDIEVSPSRFRYRVSLPPVYKVDEEAINAEDVKRILLACSNKRLKAFLLLLASSGVRATEGLALRESDINWNNIAFEDPKDTNTRAIIHVRKEYSKNRLARRIFISNECARHLKQYIDWKYRDRTYERKYYNLKNRVRSQDDLIFSTVNSTEPSNIYFKMLEMYQQTLDSIGLSERKETATGAVYRRRKITFHSFRRFVKTAISDAAGQDYSEFILGHKKSPYYVQKQSDLEHIYTEKCMRYLTFLDYPTLQTTSKNFEAQLQGAVEQLMKLILTMIMIMIKIKTRLQIAQT
jgi:integrase